MNGDQKQTTRLPSAYEGAIRQFGRPKIALNLASTRGWINLILRRMDLDIETTTLFQATADKLKSIEDQILGRR